MEYFISDLHFNHRNVLRFDSRPFENIEEMNKKLLDNINETVGPNDELFILGDIAMQTKVAIEFLKSINAKKYLITGNHDNGEFIRNSGLCKEVIPYKRITVKNEFLKKFHPEGELVVCLFHYPILSWDRQRYGAVHLFGHIHTNDCYYFDNNNQPQIFPIQNLKNSYNVFCGFQDYRPMRLDEILEKNGYYPDAYLF